MIPGSEEGLQEQPWAGCKLPSDLAPWRSLVTLIIAVLWGAVGSSDENGRKEVEDRVFSGGVLLNRKAGVVFGAESGVRFVLSL